MRRLTLILFLCAMISSLSAAQNLPRRDRVRLDKMSTSLQKLAQHASPAVVQVTTKGFYPVQGDNGNVATQSGTGSGVILDPSGYIVTNAHVIEGAEKVEVLLSTDSKSSDDEDSPEPNVTAAEIIGVDSETDLAVLKINKSNLPVLKLADSSKLRQGELVLACGSPFGLQNTISMGVVSSIARQLDPDSPVLYIQTDAPINPGNSGGPLINTKGEVVGLNAMIYSQSGGNQGLGFAIPSNVVDNIYRQIKAEGHVHHGYLGVDSKTIDTIIASALHLPTHRGVIVEDIDPDGPASDSDLQPGDIILAMGGKTVTDASKLSADIAQRPIGETISFDLVRGTDKLKVELEIGERPDDQLKFAHMVTRESNLVRQFGILALNLDDKFSDLLPELRMKAGVIVAAKVAGLPSPSDAFEAGDVIGAVNGEPVADINGLRALVSKLQPGDPVVVNIQRGPKLAILAFELP